MRALLTLAAFALLAAPADGGRLRPAGIQSADARLLAGSHKTLLKVKGLGRFTAQCGKDAQVKVTFTADRLLPTSDLVVTRTQGSPLAQRIDPKDSVQAEPPQEVLAEHWQISPFGEAQIQVATASVAARAFSEGGQVQCSASVLVTTGPDQGSTITGHSAAASGWHKVALQPAPSPTPGPPEGLSWTVPSGWQPIREQLTALAEPRHRLAAATFALKQTKPDKDCSPDSARAQMPADGAVVFILESLETNARPKALAKLPQRPAHFKVPREQGYECLGIGAIFHWTEQGRALQADVLLGPKAGKQRRDQVQALLDSLVVQKAAPPAPPIGWRRIVSGSYDSMAVPPGWSARALKHPHKTARPRMLFRITNPRHTVVVKVDELRRGRTKPPDGLVVRGFRFQTRIDAQTGAARADLDDAQISARSLGVSGVGRG